MANDFRQIDIPNLVEQINTMLSVVIEAPTNYGVTTSECEALGDLKTDLLVKYETAEDANQHKLAMFDTRNMAWAEVLNLLAEFTKRAPTDGWAG